LVVGCGLASRFCSRHCCYLGEKKTYARFFKMRSTFAISLLAGVVVSAEGLLDLPLDIAGLLSSLSPAPPTDPRWTDWHPAGSSDGTCTPAIHILHPSH
jgi:hypothetical protein